MRPWRRAAPALPRRPRFSLARPASLAAGIQARYTAISPQARRTARVLRRSAASYVLSLRGHHEHVHVHPVLHRHTLIRVTHPAPPVWPAPARPGPMRAPSAPRPGSAGPRPPGRPDGPAPEPVGTGRGTPAAPHRAPPGSPHRAAEPSPSGNAGCPHPGEPLRRADSARHGRARRRAAGGSAAATRGDLSGRQCSRRGAAGPGAADGPGRHDRTRRQSGPGSRSQRGHR